MKIAFVTTQTLAGSTNIGRILPLAEQLSADHDVHVLVHQNAPAGKTPGVLALTPGVKDLGHGD